MQNNSMQSGLSRLELSGMSIMSALFFAVSVITAMLSGCDAGQIGGETLLVDAGTVSAFDSGVACNAFLCEEGRLHAWTGNVFQGSCEFSVGITRTCDFGCNAAKSECMAMPDGAADAGNTADAGAPDTGVPSDSGVAPDAAPIDSGTPSDAGICTIACMNLCAGDGIHLDIVTGCAADHTCRASGSVIDCSRNTPGGVCRAVNGVQQCVVIATDGGVVADAGSPADASANPDATVSDTGVPPDSGIPPDSGLSFLDSGVVADSGIAPDTGVPPDSGVAPDSGGALDSSVADASAVDASVSDAGGVDASIDGGVGSRDAGNSCGSALDCLPNEVCGWTGQCVPDQLCTGFGVFTTSRLDFYPATGPDRVELARVTPDWSASQPYFDCSAVATDWTPASTATCICQTYLGQSQCASLPNTPTVFGCTWNQPGVRGFDGGIPPPHPDASFSDAGPSDAGAPD